MATEVDLTDPKVVKSVHKDWRPVLKTAAAMGWTGRSSSTHVTIASPDGVHTIGLQMATGGLDSGKLRAAARLLARLSPAEKMHEALDDVAEEDKTVVSVEPWMARVGSNGGQTDLYPSNSVSERKWSDGSVDYICPVQGCDRSSPNPRSIASHAQVHTRKGEKPPADTTPTVFDQKIDGPRTRRIAGLAREIAEAMNAMGERGTMTRDEAARAMAEFIVNQRIAKGAERIEEDPEKHEPEDVLSRIKTLVLREESRAWENERRGLETERQTLAQERDAAVAAANKAKETLRSLAELAADDL